MMSILYVSAVSSFDLFLVYFSMVFTRGSGSGGSKRQCVNDDEIRRSIAMELDATVT